MLLFNLLLKQVSAKGVSHTLVQFRRSFRDRIALDNEGLLRWRRIQSAQGPLIAQFRGARQLDLTIRPHDLTLVLCVYRIRNINKALVLVQDARMPEQDFPKRYRIEDESDHENERV